MNALRNFLFGSWIRSSLTAIGLVIVLFGGAISFITTVPTVDFAVEKTVEELTDVPLHQDGSSTYVFTLTVSADQLTQGTFIPTGLISVTDTVPEGLEYIDIDADPSQWICSPPATLLAPLTYPDSFTCLYQGITVLPTTAVLEPITVTVKVPLGLGQYTNCAAVKVIDNASDPDPINDEACATIGTQTPPLTAQCGTDVIFVVDVSGSIQAAGEQGSVHSAVSQVKQLFINLNAQGVPARGEVITFSNTATVFQPLDSATLTSTPLFEFIGQTNWEAAMQLAFLEAEGLAPAPVVIVFITDGDPNQYVLDTGEIVSTSNPVLATLEAVEWVTLIYGDPNAGVPIFGILIGSDPTYLNALLGTDATITNFDDLSSDLQNLGRELCPDLYLSKSISPTTINYYDNPGPHNATITLTLHNTNGPLTDVQIQDALPPELINPTNFVGANASVLNDVVTWDISTLAADATLEFQVTVKPPELDCAVFNVTNFAQVTAVEQNIHSTPNSIVHPVTGPAVEHDESSATLGLNECPPPPCPGPDCPCPGPNCPCPGPDCPVPPAKLLISKSTIEVCFPQEQIGGIPDGAEPCSFTVTVMADGNFSGEVTFGDAIFGNPSGQEFNAGVASIIADTSLAPSSPGPFCLEMFESLPSNCTQGITLDDGHSIEFTIALIAPPNFVEGNYRNCFIAEEGVTQEPNYLAYIPSTPDYSNASDWGHCGTFSVPTPESGTLGITKTVDNTTGGLLSAPQTFGVEISCANEVVSSNITFANVPNGITTQQNIEIILVGSDGSIDCTLTETVPPQGIAIAACESGTASWTIAPTQTATVHAGSSPTGVTFINKLLCDPPQGSPSFTIEKVLSGINGDPTDTIIDEITDTVTYTVTVVNTGEVDLTDVELTDSISGGLILVDGDSDGNGVLDVDEIWVYRYDVELTQVDIEEHLVDNALENTVSAVTAQTEGSQSASVVVEYHP